MFIGPEKLAEMFNKGSKAGPAINSSVNRCAGCPFAGICTPCKPTVVKSEVSVGVTTGSFSFRPAGEIVRPVTSGETCSQCGKNPTTCLHSARTQQAA